MSSCIAFTSNTLVRERALWSALAAAREKEGELAITSLKFEYLHRKSRFETLIGEDDISNYLVRIYNTAGQPRIGLL